eukprot:GFUD01014182.1.p1 GENE.GFUD01014182.1~~GFUD01014182.1.p1  ORF type:complete len:513 (+),score=133.50 GFUD01014182.1:219-1541(+)
MDYTLCEYYPEFDELAFTLAKRFIVDNLGYPEEVLDIEYNPQFPVRCLWFDRNTGNLLKVDQFGKILDCCHGFRILKSEEIKSIYPGKIQRKDDKRIFVMNTVFNLAETYLVAALINHFECKEDTVCTATGWVRDGQEVTFAKVFKDLRAAIDDMHVTSLLLKKTCLANLTKYVKKDDRLPVMLARIKSGGRKTFLLTNSDWWYTRQIMNFLLGKEDQKDQDFWMSYFDLVVVDACKPRFFSTGTPLQRVETTSSTLLPLSACLPGPEVYSGGDHITITTMLGAKGPDVIYAGDHLLADVIKCRKLCEWRTLLIIPELSHELEVTQKNVGLLSQLSKMEALIADNPELGELKMQLWETVNKLKQDFGGSGSLFRSGSKLSYFGSQVMIWADVYTGSVSSLAGYELEHRFVTDTVKLPHERDMEDEFICSSVSSSLASQVI